MRDYCDGCLVLLDLVLLNRLAFEQINLLRGDLVGVTCTLSKFNELHNVRGPSWCTSSVA
jgi:hypothetical protein